MRTSSTRRLSAALSASALALVFSLGSPAFGGEQGQGDEHRKDRTEATSGRPASSSSDDDSIADTEPVPVDEDNAHPSGNDRHEDNGAQGYSMSEPDDNDRGPERDYQGTDKPFDPVDGSGGMDIHDQDGNNGCGNDDDFEDDNEGWCGKPASAGPDTPPVVVGGTGTETCPEGTTMTKGGTAPEDCKKPEVVTGGSTPTVTATSTETLASGAVLGTDLQAAPAESAQVMGIQLERTAPEAAVAAETLAAPAAGASVLGVSLARTGLGSTMVALALALGLLAVGFALKRAGRTTTV